MLQPCSRLEYAVLQVILRKQGDCSLRTCVCSSFNDWGCSVCSGVVVTIGVEADQRRRLNDSVCLQVINGANESKLLVADRIRNRLVEWCVYEACNLAEAGFKIIGGQGAPVRDYWRNKKFVRPITSRSDWLGIAATPPLSLQKKIAESEAEDPASVPAIVMPVRLPNTSSLFTNLRKVDSGDL